jgi:HD-like signal output (HDOD) protein/CheY-like chemotaxis protein
MGTLLIVDRSPFCREMLCHFLESHGYGVAGCQPGETMAALELGRFDLLLMGIGSDDFSGLAVLSGLRQNSRLKDLPVIVLADVASREAVLHTARLGVRDYMLKANFSTTELLTRIGKYVAGGNVAANTAGAAASSPAAAAGAPPAPAAPVVTVSTPANGAKRLVSGGGAGPVTTPEEDRRALTAAARELGLPVLAREQMVDRVNAAKVRTLPGAVTQLISLVSSPRGTVADVAKVLKRDPVLSARVLQLSNSAAYSGHRGNITSVEEAVKYIGVGGVRNLIASVGVFEVLAGGGTAVARCWQHSLAVAALMEKLTPPGEAAPAGTPYVVGLCHDLADIMLRQYFAEEYARVLQLVGHTGRPQRQAEAVVFGLPYDELAALLLSRLGLPPVITAPIQELFERAAYKRAPGAGSVLGRSLRMANVYAHGLMMAASTDEPVVPLTRVEVRGTYGEGVPPPIDDEALRAEAMMTAGLLWEAADMSEEWSQPLAARRPLRVGYARHAEYSELDPVLALLRLTCERVTVLPGLAAPTPAALQHGPDAEPPHALVVSARRAADPVDVRKELRALCPPGGKRAVPVLYMGSARAGDFGPIPPGVTIHRLPSTIADISEFLARVAGEPPAAAAPGSASAPNAEIVRAA